MSYVSDLQERSLYFFYGQITAVLSHGLVK